MSPRLIVDLQLQRPGFHLDARFQSETGRLALLGPSGAGKSTLLACLAGFLRPQSGRIQVEDRVLLDTRQGVDIPVQRRRIGLVTQQGALFPHLSLEENLVFALRSQPRRPTRSEALAEARTALDRLGLQALQGRLPDQVSGGQVRRAELARALVTRPALALLDEPFSALDPQTRSATEAVFRQFLAESACPWVLVTHDRAEALGLAEEIGVVLEGSVRQVGRANEVFFRPADRQVAEFLGGELAWEAEVLRCDSGLAQVQVGPVTLAAAVEEPLSAGLPVIATLRPEDVTLWPGNVPEGGSSRNHLQGRVSGIETRGFHVLVRLDAGIPVASLLTRGAASELLLEPGTRLGLSFKATRLHLIPRMSLPPPRSIE